LQWYKRAAAKPGAVNARPHPGRSFSPGIFPLKKKFSLTYRLSLFILRREKEILVHPHPFSSFRFFET